MAWLRCVLVFGAFIKLSVTEDLSANVSKLLGSILDEYDIRLRPNFAHQPLSLGMQLTIVSFDSISEVNMDYTVTMHLHQYWTDERLSFNSEELSSNRLVDILNLSSDFAERIWLPDTFLANDKSSFIHDVTQKNKMIRLHSNGDIVYGMRFTTTLACMMDLHHYPLDTQNCTIEIESYGYPVDDILMYWKEEPVIGLKDLTLPQFTIYKFETKDRQEELATGNYQRLSLSIKLQRNTGYFMFQTYLPSILIVMLSWVSFWINHEATSARVTLGITTVLTMTTISTGIRSSLPRISYVKAIDIYLVVCFIFVFAALLEYAAVNYTYWSIRPTKHGQSTSKTCHDCDRSLHDDPDREDEEDIRLSPIPCLRRDTNMQRHRYARGFRLIGLEQNLIWTTNNDVQPRPMPINRKKEEKTPVKETKISVQMGIRDVNAIDRTSRFVFPITFALFNVTYWGFYVI